MNHELPDELELMKNLDVALPPYQDKLVASTDPRIVAAQRLAQGPDVRLSNVALNRIEAQLRSRMAELHPAPVPKAKPSRRVFRPGPWLRYAAAACLVFILIVSSVAQVSASALPGDTLYSVKRTIETGRLAVVSDNGEPGLRVDIAARRVDEFEKLLLEHGRIYPYALEEASDQLDRSLHLLERGFGDQIEISIRIIALTSEQERLINLALPLTSQEMQQELSRVASDVVKIQSSAMVLSPNTKPEIVPTALPMPTWEVSATPSSTVSPTLTPTPTIVSTQTRTPVSTPQATKTPKPHLTTMPEVDEVIPTISVPDVIPTRTPPGHGATPGLGDNPPGQGGDNPGQGNDGSPPGQDKPDKPDKPEKDK